MTELLQRVRPFDERHPLWWDVAPALLIAAISVNATATLDPLGVGLLVIAHGAVVFRRRRPLPALLVAFFVVLLAATVTLLTPEGMPWLYLAVWLLLFNVGLRQRGVPVAVIGVIIVVTAATALATPGAQELLQADVRIRSSLAVLGMSAASFLLGLQLRSQREQVVAQRAEAARAAVVAERSRIAQEMHDIIGHNLSVITSLATGGAVAARTSPREVVATFDAIGSVSRSSVREVRRVLAVLQQDHSAAGASLSPQPGLEDISALVESVRGTGLDVRLERVGDLAGLSAGRQLAVYRIVQESLTNVLRHATASALVAVRIARERDGLVVSVEDTGSALAGAGRAPENGPGQGIMGMRERAEAYGGSLEAGRRGSGWLVRARIPADQNESRP